MSSVHFNQLVTAMRIAKLWLGYPLDVPVTTTSILRCAPSHSTQIVTPKGLIVFGTTNAKAMQQSPRISTAEWLLWYPGVRLMVKGRCMDDIGSLRRLCDIGGRALYR